MHLVIGDVHGHVASLRTVLHASGVFYRSDTKVILLGDYVDKGPYSWLVVSEIQKMMSDAPGRVFAVLGNHDEYYVRYARHLRKREQDPSYVVPMTPNEESLDVYRTLGSGRVDFLAGLPRRYAFDVDGARWNAVHAGLEPGDPHSDEKVLRIRYVDPASGKSKGLGPGFSVPEGTQYWAELYDGDVNVVYGHHVHSRERPVETRGQRGQRLLSVDTGCGYDGILSAVSIETGEVWQANADGDYVGKTEVARF